MFLNFFGGNLLNKGALSHAMEAVPVEDPFRRLEIGVEAFRDFFVARPHLVPMQRMIRWEVVEAGNDFPFEMEVPRLGMQELVALLQVMDAEFVWGVMHRKSEKPCKAQDDDHPLD